MTTPIEGTTPRPWMVADESTREHGAEVAIIEFGLSIVRPSDGSLIEPGDPRADAALIVAAVNSYDRLRAVQLAAYWYRAMIRAGGPDGSELDAAVMQDLDRALGDFEP